MGITVEHPRHAVKPGVNEGVMSYLCTHHFFVSTRLHVYSVDLKDNRESPSQEASLGTVGSFTRPQEGPLWAGAKVDGCPCLSHISINFHTSLRLRRCPVLLRNAKIDYYY